MTFKLETSRVRSGAGPGWLLQFQTVTYSCVCDDNFPVFWNTPAERDSAGANLELVSAQLLRNYQAARAVEDAIVLAGARVTLGTCHSPLTQLAALGSGFTYRFSGCHRIAVDCFAECR